MRNPLKRPSKNGKGRFCTPAGACLGFSEGGCLNFRKGAKQYKTKKEENSIHMLVIPL